MKKIFISPILILIMGAAYAQADLQTLYDQSMEAYEQKDYASFLSKTKAANELRPNHPSIVYNLAGAYALNDSLDQSIRVLRQLFMMNPDVKVEEDTDFKNILGTKEFKSLKAWIARNNQPIQLSSQALTFDHKSLHPEGFAVDQKTGTFYFGGFHDRKIIKVSEEGVVSNWISYNKVPELFGVTGVLYDAKREVVWVCTTVSIEPVEVDTESQAGMSSVLAFDKEGNLLKSARIQEGNFFGDLILRQDGGVLISDSQSNKIYHMSLTENLTVWADLSDQILNLQGIAFDKKESTMIVADYLTGLYRYSVTEKSLQKLILPDTVSDKGYDGIYYYKKSIVAIQNGTKPNRVYQFKLDKSQSSIVKVDVIDQALPVFDEPTQGTIVKRKFYYLANSPWQLYQDGELLVDEVPETVILAYRLK